MFRILRNRSFAYFSETIFARFTTLDQTPFHPSSTYGTSYRMITIFPQDMDPIDQDSIVKQRISSSKNETLQMHYLEDRSPESGVHRQKIAVQEMIESCRRIVNQSKINLDSMESICDLALSQIDFGAISTSHLIQIIELLGEIYSKSDGIPKTHFTNFENSKSENQRDGSVVDLTTTGDFIRKELGEFEAEELSTPHPESEEIIIEKLDDLQMGKPIRFRNQQWFLKRGIDITQPKESWYPKVPRKKTEFIEKLLQAPLISDESSELESNLEGYQTAVFVNKATGIKRTRVVFEDDLRSSSIFHDRDLDPDAQRDRVYNLGENEEQIENSWEDLASKGDLNAQIQVVRVLGSEVKKASRLRRMSPKELFKSTFGFCNMKYKRDALMKSLMSYLRIQDVHSQLTNQDLSDLINGLGDVGYENERILGRICEEVMEPQRLKDYQHGEVVKLMLGMANLKYYDQQVVTTLAFQLRSDLETVSKEEVVLCLLGLAKSGIRELGLILDLLEYLVLLDSDGMVGLNPKLMLRLLEAVMLLQLSEFEVMKSLGIKISQTWTRDYLLQFSNDQLCQLCKLLSPLGQLNANLISLILVQLLENACYKDLSNEALVNLFHGLRMAPCDFNQEQITSLLQELTDTRRLKNYGLDQISDLILSLSFLKLESNEHEVVATLWIEVCHEVRCRRYSASQLTDIFEAVSRSPSLPEDQLWNLMTHALTPDRLDQIRMPHFVSMLDSLSRIQCKDKTIISKLIKEFVRPSRLAQLNAIAIPSVLKSIVDLNLPDRNRLEFLTMEMRRMPSKMSEWSTEEINFMYRALRQLQCKDAKLLESLKQEMEYRAFKVSK